MTNDNYFHWLTNETPTTWWHDSGDPDEVRYGLSNGAIGVTTNPVLIYTTLHSNPEKWMNVLKSFAKNLSPRERAEFLLRGVIQNTAELLKPEYERTKGKTGYVCAQVDPAIAGDRDAMLQMAKRFHGWAPNVAVKLPATAAGLDVLEECAGQGMTVTATVGFTVPQVIAVAERYRRGLARAQKTGRKHGRCFAVIMIGRLDDYLIAAAKDSNSDIGISDLQKAGIAVTKRAYSLYKEHNYEAVLMVAALRGTYHMEELTGADLIMSIHPKYQKMLLQPGIPRDPRRIDMPVDSKVIERLKTIPEFVRAYEPDGMKPNEFMTFGLTQRTLSQFIAAGWSLLENFKV